MNNKVLIFSDIHIDAHKKSNDRLDDCLAVLEWIFKTAVERNIKTLIFSGDLYHDRQRINVLAYQKTFEVFLKYFASSDMEVYLLLGNHDLWFYERWDVSSVMPLKAIRGVHVVNEPCLLQVLNRPVGFLPYTHDPAADLAKLPLGPHHRAPSVLFGHVAIDGAILNSLHNTHSEVCIEHDGEMTKVSTEIFHQWDRVFLGHYHAAQQLTDKIEYVGSPLELSFGEAFQEKHIIIYDLDTDEKEYVVNDFSPKHLIIRDKDVDKFDLNKNFVKIIVDEIIGSDIVEMRSELSSKFDIGSLEIKAVPKIEEDEHIVEDAKSILLQSSDKMCSMYLDEIEKNSELKLERSKLMSIFDLIKERLAQNGTN